MSKNPTVAELATRATSTISNLTDVLARNFIRANNIRSNGKLDSMIESLKGKTDDELQALCAVPEVAAQRAASTTTAKAKKPAKTSAKAEAKFERKGRTARTTAISEGPRGFRFGEVWCNSIKAGAGIALLDVNRPKLIKHAESLGVAASVIASGDAAKIAKSLALKLEKQA